MTVDLPKRGELVTIRWPGGPYDFEIEFAYEAENHAPLWPGWILLHGLVTKPNDGRQGSRSFYVHLADDGVWELLPMRSPNGSAGEPSPRL